MPSRTYTEIKGLILRSYLRHALNRGVAQRWSIEQVLGSVDDELENTFENPLEQAMAQVVLMALAWPDAGLFHGTPRTKLQQTLNSPTLSIAIEQLPLAEKEELKNDLQVLGLEAT